MTHAYTVLQKIFLSLIATAALSLTNSWLLLSPVQASPAWWNRIFSSRPPDPPQPRGSRGDEICWIAPDATSEASRVWGDRATLVWQGAVHAVELWQPNGTEWLWRTAVTSANQLEQVQVEAGRSAYQVTADIELQPGQQYEWRIYQLQDSVSTPVAQFSMPSFISIPFAVVAPEQQAQIQQNLPAAGDTGEAAAIQRADYFASQQLWMDFWREMLSIEQPSADLSRVMSNTFSNLCPRLDIESSLDLSSLRSQTRQPYRDFSLTGIAGQSIEISLESEDFTPLLVLLDPDGEIISEVVSDGRQSRLETTLLEDGAYTIRVTSTLQATGSYRLRVVSLW